MPADRCRADECAKSGSYGRGCCGEHYFAELRAENPRDVAAARAAARATLTRAAAAAPAQVRTIRPLHLVLLCPGCGRRHQVPAAALDFPCLMPCQTWLKPALTVKGA
jgi:hypothetical protein